MRVAYIGMGANLPSAAGPPEATLAAAAERLETLGRVTGRSRLYSTAPVGFAEQPRFLNAAVALETSLEPRELLRSLLEIEREFGRGRPASVANGPRTLDLDILLFGGMTVSEPGLEIPHTRLASRGFALVPLREIAASVRDPRAGATVLELYQRLIPGAEVGDAVVPIQSEIWRPCGVAGDGLAACDVGASG